MSVKNNNVLVDQNYENKQAMVVENIKDLLQLFMHWISVDNKIKHQLIYIYINHMKT